MGSTIPNIYIIAYFISISMFDTKNQILALLAGLLLIIASATKSTAGSFSVSPMVNISDTRGGQAKGAINVTNSGKEPLRIRVYAEDFTYNRNKGYVSIPTHDRSAIRYLQFSPRELTIPPGVTRNVRVGITLPPNAPDGEYRASVFIEELKENKIDSITSTRSPIIILNARVASVFFIAKGGVKANLQVNTAVWDNQQKTLNIVLTNQGKKSAYPSVNWKISQNGKEVSDGNILGVVLQSDTDREVILRTKDKNLSLPAGNYQLSGEIVNDQQKPIPFSIGVSIP
jgi:P pilus assembly chaperone PapD